MLDRGERLVVGLTLTLAVGGVIAMAVTRRASDPPSAVSPSAPRADDLPKVATISHGGQVDLDRHIAPVGRTVVEFTAGW